MNQQKHNLHPRNVHRQQYDFELLVSSTPELADYITWVAGRQSIDFSNSNAVKLLNKALLAAYYNIRSWDLPTGYLTPGVPGRADYIHHIADLLAATFGEIPIGPEINGLDIGTGANIIYPMLGNAIYKWNFVATDIDQHAIANCVNIIESNPHLADAITLQQQLNPRYIFNGIIADEDRFAFTICNPPFHASAEEAAKGSIRKINHLSKSKATSPLLNFGGQHNELWREGGELKFISDMIYESRQFKQQCIWFTTLVSKASNLAPLEKLLNNVGVAKYNIINMSQGQKQSRILAWIFRSEAELKSHKF